MIKTKPIKFKQRSAGNETILIESAEDYPRRAVLFVGRNQFGQRSYRVPVMTAITLENHELLPTMTTVTVKTKTAPRAGVERLISHAQLMRHRYPQALIQNIVDTIIPRDMKKANTLHWISELVDGTTDCASLPAIAPREQIEVVVNLA